MFSELEGVIVVSSIMIPDILLGRWFRYNAEESF